MQINGISAGGYNQKTPTEIEAKLIEKGLIPTGNLAQDMQLLQTASQKGDDENSTINPSIAQKPSPPSQSELPWADLLSKLNLSPQGSKEADLSAISNKISELEASAKSDSEKANVDGLKSEYQQAVAAAASLQPPSAPTENFAGMQNLASMNRHFMGI